MELLGIILFSVFFSAFFSGVEIAFISSNRFHIEIENKKGDFSSRLLSRLVTQPSRFIATMLVGNNIALVVYGIFMPEVLDPYLGGIGQPFLLLLIQTVISTLIILVFAEFLPKAVFNTHSNRLLQFFALPSYLFHGLFYPVVALMIGLSEFIMNRVFKSAGEPDQEAFSKVDLDNYIRERTEAAGKDAEEEHPEIQIFRNALEFGDQKARDFMVPRPEIVALDVTSGIEALKDQFVESKLSKILIYKDSIDNIIGYTHAFELFKKPDRIRAILRPVSFIPESMTADEVLNLLIRQRRSLAVVLDEFGGTAGIVTIEDVMEELFGEIDDEHDTEDLVEKRVKEGEYLFSARQEIDYLNQKYNLELPEAEQYSTLGGLILNHLESIPEKGEELRLEPYLFKVEEVSHTKIELVRLKITDE